MVAIGLLYGDLNANHYEDEVACDPRVDYLRSKMVVIENQQFSKDYLLAEKRSIANSIKLYFNDGTESDSITVEYPIGHRRRRTEGTPVLMSKFKTNLATQFSEQKIAEIITKMSDTNALSAMSVVDFMAMWSV